MKSKTLQKLKLDDSFFKASLELEYFFLYISIVYFDEVPGFYEL